MKAMANMLVHYFSRLKPLGESKDAKEYFSKIYVRNAWGGRYSRSGRGSEGEFAIHKKNLLSDIIKKYEIESVVDIGCGDFYWMKDLGHLLKSYHGLDVVEEIVRFNEKEYGSGDIKFQCLDMASKNDQSKLSVRKADLVVCLDVFGHLLNAEVDSLFQFILCDMDAKYILLTNRREPGSTDYLKREKSRHEGIDLECHPLFVQANLNLVARFDGMYPKDFFDLYSKLRLQ